ncbi:unnamed protein product, partial [Amoebophrya sp. A25]|eukprot:GSA25T00006060001.1
MSKLQKRTAILSLGMKKGGSAQSTVNSIIEGREALAKDLITHCRNKCPISRKICSKPYCDDFFAELKLKAKFLKTRAAWVYLSSTWRRRLKAREKTPKLKYTFVKEALQASKRQNLLAEYSYVRQAWAKICCFVIMTLLRHLVVKTLAKMAAVIKGYTLMVEHSYPVWTWKIFLSSLNLTPLPGEKSGAGKL